MVVNRKVLLIVSLVLFVDSIGSSFVLPLLPTILLNDVVKITMGLGLNKTLMYGLATAVVPLFSIMSLPIFGYLSDNCSKKSLIVSGLIFFITSNLFAIVAIMMHSYYLFLLSRIIVGISVGTYSVAYLMLNDLSNDTKELAHMYMWVSAASMAGSLIGPLFSILVNVSGLSLYSLMTPFILDLCLLLINIIIVYGHFNEENNCKPRIKVRDFLHAASKSVKVIIRIDISDIDVRRLCIVFAISQFILGLYVQTYSLYLAEVFNYNPQKISLFSLFIMSGIIINNTVIYNYISRYLEIKFTLLLMTFLLSLIFIIKLITSFLSLSMFCQLIVYYLFSLALFMVLGILSAMTNAIVLKIFPESHSGIVFSILGMITAFSWFIAAFIGSSLIIRTEYILSIISIILFYIAFYLINNLQANRINNG